MNWNKPGVNTETKKDQIPGSRQNKQILYSGLSSSGLKDRELSITRDSLQRGP